ncbi:MAG: DUF89 family protein, partial [Thermoplasmata archaeon]|nr:DUF89 family protein [Thermoplasmata archaeon]
PIESISFVVKGGPILNDATMDDAIQAGIDTLPGVSFLRIGNGEEGTGPERDSKEVKGWIEAHDLTISKGQGNFEGLSEFRGVYYLLTVKCPPVSRYAGVPVGERVLLYR